ncbi:MAG: carboxylating nicotinate-nucleotide diphosphorylase [Gemmatimonadetes bacterium]|nr:carboxylating nicotinate-nucleotide diphosphorylase [Gemmatimonadota bacterium]
MDPGERWTEAAEADARVLVALALSEDVGAGDWTTLWAVDPDVQAEATVLAKAPLVLAGAAVARLAFHSVDAGLVVEVLGKEGPSLAPGTEILHVCGSARSILTAERTALNFLGRLSGIATLTRQFVDAVKGTRARITDTRKTTPGWRHLEKWAVRVGGGTNHRMGLHDMILVKDNHIAIAGGVAEVTRRVLARNTVGLPVEVEVTRLQELEELRGLGVDRILLDNMELKTMAEAVRRVGEWPDPRPELEASGTMTLDRVRAVAETGVDWISIGALTHSVRTADLSLRVSPGLRPLAEGSQAVTSRLETPAAVHGRERR